MLLHGRQEPYLGNFLGKRRLTNNPNQPYGFIGQRKSITQEKQESNELGYPATGSCSDVCGVSCSLACLPGCWFAFGCSCGYNCN